MKQIFEKRLTKRGVRTFETRFNNQPLFIVYSDIENLTPVFRGVSTIEAQEDYVARLIREGLRVQVRGFSSKYGTVESYLQRSGVTEFTEVIL